MGKIIHFFYTVFPKIGKTTYAQYGEDVLIEGLCHTVGIAKPGYIDIGTHHATNLSNTYFFYKKGLRGVCIEPSPILAQQIKKRRPQDIVEAVGVGAENSAGAVPYYVLTAQTMNTFLKEDAAHTISAPEMYGTQKVERIEQIEIIGVNDILKKYCAQYGDIVSIDTEGMDEEIVRAIDFTKYRPKIFCIETITQTNEGSFGKNNALISFLKGQGYIVYADTYVNTIFVDQSLWKYGTTII